MFSGAPTYALEMTSVEFIQSELDDILNDEDAVIEIEKGRVIATRDENYDRSSLGDDIGKDIVASLEELTIDTEANQLSRFRLLLEDDQREQLELYDLTFSTWEQINPSDIPENVFAEETGLSDREVVNPVPDEIGLSLGLLELNSIDLTTPTSGRAVYTGPDSMELEVRMGSAAGNLDDSWRHSHQFEIDGGSGIWHGDQFDTDTPTSAAWETKHAIYSLFVRELPDDGWTEADLYKLIETINRYQADHESW